MAQKNMYRLHIPSHPHTPGTPHLASLSFPSLSQTLLVDRYSTSIPSSPCYSTYIRPRLPLANAHLYYHHAGPWRLRRPSSIHRSCCFLLALVFYRSFCCRPVIAISPPGPFHSRRWLLGLLRLICFYTRSSTLLALCNLSFTSLSFFFSLTFLHLVFFHIPQIPFSCSRPQRFSSPARQFPLTHRTYCTYGSSGVHATSLLLATQEEK